MRHGCVAIGLFLALAAPAAAGQIVVGESIRGVALGETRAQVVQRLGRPDRERRQRSPAGRVRLLGYERLAVTLREGRVIGVRTTAVRDVTARGVGVGATRRAVRRRVDGARCADGRCRVGRRRRGRALTQFGLRRGRVASVAVARVLPAP